MSAKYTYRLEVQSGGQWVRLFERSKDFCLGYMERANEFTPRVAMRIVRSDGKVIDQIQMSDTVFIGMVAGWPTPEQYRQAAYRALANAEELQKIRDRM